MTLTVRDIMTSTPAPAPPSPAVSPLRALARVNVAAIERNVARLRGELRGGTELCAVVKADGYGHGAAPAARAALAGGATWLAVATADEAAQLRADGVDGPLLVLGRAEPRGARRRARRARRRRRVARGRSSPRWPRAAAGACTSSSTPGWAAWARATRRRPTRVARGGRGERGRRARRAR